ncbi:MAG: hypothetical protein Q4D76_17565 [Oscillospiraceae bacterium]|nr:hypothetical protein [Oscillospiraceae bacterium]
MKVLLFILFMLLVLFMIAFPFVVLPILHSPLSKIEDDLAKELKKYGLVHYTTKNSAEKILKSGSIFPGRGMYLKEKNLVWLYSAKDFNELKSENVHVLKYLRGKKVEAAIRIKVTDDIISKLTYRKGVCINGVIPLRVYKDKAITHKGKIPIQGNDITVVYMK